MAFFDPPPPRRPLEDDAEFRPQQDWEGAPRGVVGQPVSVKAVVVCTEEMSISVVGIAAFPTGIEFTLLGLRRPHRAPPDRQSIKQLPSPWHRDESRATVDATPIAAAASQATRLWPDDLDA